MDKCALSSCKQTQLGVTCKQCCYGLDKHGRKICTSYCSEGCLSADQNAHKKDCRAANARRNVYRAGMAAFLIYLDYRSLAFERPVTAIGIQGLDQYLQITEEITVKEEDIFHTFPYHLINHRGHTSAVLSYGAAHESIQITKRLLLWALGGQKCCLVVKKAEG